MQLIKAGILLSVSKVFDILKQALFVAELTAYREALLFIFSNLTERRHKVKVDGSYSTWKVKKIGVPQGSVLGPL